MFTMLMSWFTCWFWVITNKTTDPILNLLSDNSCNVVIHNVQYLVQGMTNIVRFTFSVGGATWAVIK